VTVADNPAVLWRDAERSGVDRWRDDDPDSDHDQRAEDAFRIAGVGPELSEPDERTCGGGQPRGRGKILRLSAHGCTWVP
jgi:hypothetical protein